MKELVPYKSNFNFILPESSQIYDQEESNINILDYDYQNLDIKWLDKKTVYSSDWLKDDTEEDNILLEVKEDVSSLKSILTKLEKKHDKHASQSEQEHEEMLKLVETYERENQYFRSKMADIYTPAKLKRYSVLAFSMSAFTLFTSRFLLINLIHPILSYLVIAISLGFLSMSLIMKKRLKK